MRLGIALAAAMLAACETVSPAAKGPTRVPEMDSPSLSPEPIKVAFVQDLSTEVALDRTLPALQAVELAFSNAALDDTTVAVELIAFDVAGDPAAAEEVAADIGADPAYVAAIAAPNLGGQQALAHALGDVPLLSLSAGGGAIDREPGKWVRFVAPLPDQAIALANLAISRPRSRRGVCLAPSAADGAGFDRLVRRALEPDADAIDAHDAGVVLAAGCRVVVFTGEGIGGARLALALDGTGIAVVGGSGLLAPDFIEDAGRSAEGVLSICSCADVSTSLGLAAQRFIQDYQSEYGSPPGPFAVEAWDAAHLLLQTLRQPTPSRAGVAASIGETSAFDGLGGTYRFEGGELADPHASIRIYRVEGGRWILIEALGETGETDLASLSGLAFRTPGRAAG
jgi:ABC-type branched-subunit amino acid transport system substrate-binding protein